MPAPLAAAVVPLLRVLLGGALRGAAAGARIGGRSLARGVARGARGIRGGFTRGIRNTARPARGIKNTVRPARGIGNTTSPARGIRGGFTRGIRNTARGGMFKGSKGKGTKGGSIVKKTNDSAITRSENGGLAVQGRTIKEGGALTSSLGPSSQKSTSIIKTGPTKSNVLGLLEDIKKTADQILEVEVKELDNDNKEYKDTKKEQAKERKLLEAEKRDEEEEKQESKKAQKGKSKPNPVVRAAKKGIGNIFEFLLDLFKDFVVFKILDWIGDPKNKEKVHQLVKFIGAIPGALKFMWKNFVEPWWEFSKKLFGGGFKIFMSFFEVFKDVITLNWLTNPGDFFDNLMEIPKTLIEVVPGIIGSLLDAVTGGAITKIGDLVGKLFNNPLKGIDLGSVTSLLGSAAGFVKGLLGNTWSGITNAVGGLFGGGGDKKKEPPKTSATRQQERTSSTKTSTPAKPATQPVAAKPLTKTSGTKDLGDRNYGIKEGGFKTVTHKGKKYYFTRRKNGTWGVHIMEKNDRGNSYVQKNVDAGGEEGLVQAFDKEHGGMSDPTGRGTDPPAAAPTGSGGNPYGMIVTSHAMQNRNLKVSTGMHMGVDIAGPTPEKTAGVPLQAFTDATITGNGVPSAGYGNWVSWTDTAGLEHFYAHMKKPTPFKVGDKVKAGTKLGAVGNTGNSDGAHLHWEVSTTPGDTGRSKASVLSRINPLSKYAFTAPFGGSTAPAAGSAVDAPPPAPTDVRSSPSKSGPNLNNAQQESKQLATKPKATQQPTIVNNSTSTQSVSEQSEGFSGDILPTSGLWAIYSYHL